MHASKSLLIGLTTVLLSTVWVFGQQVITLPEGKPALELVGQVTNSSPTTSQQYGYISFVTGLGTNVFSGTPAGEATAELTFVTNAQTQLVVLDGPLRVIHRFGTTTIYRNTAPADFSNPRSFAAGTPIQISSFRQQVVIDTLTGSFTTVNLNTIKRLAPFSISGKTYLLGAVGNSFRTSLAGHLNSPGAVPSGWFSGYAVGIQ
jgi:hypothetical protein